MSVCIVVFVGLPGSGKTTLAKRLQDTLKESEWVVHCTAYDELISLEKQKELASGDGTKEGSTRDYRSLMKVYVENALKSIDPQSSSPSAIFVDDNNYYRSMRYEFYQQAAEYCTGYLQIFIACSAAEACQSNRSRPVEMQVPDEVIWNMNAKLEVPSESWENTLKILHSDLGNTDILDMVLHRIREAAETPVLTKKLAEERKVISDVDRVINQKSVVHNADQVLRKFVSETIKKRRNQNDEINLLAKNLNEHRHKFMLDLKQNFALPSSVLGDHNNIDMQLLKEWIVPKFLASFNGAHDNMLES